APLPVLHEGRRWGLPGQHHHGREPERARGGDGAPQAPRAPVQQGSGHLRDLREPLPRALDARGRPDLRAPDPAPGRLSANDAIFVIFNPRSGKGRGARFVEPVLAALASAPSLEHALTTGPGDEARLAELALARGFRKIVAVGGDGTWSHV